MQRKTLITFQMILFSVLTSLGLAINLSAQINRANLNGTVTDASGARVPDAEVAVVAPDTGFTRQAATGRSGVYSIPDAIVNHFPARMSCAATGAEPISVPGASSSPSAGFNPLLRK